MEILYRYNKRRSKRVKLVKASGNLFLKEVHTVGESYTIF